MAVDVVGLGKFLKGQLTKFNKSFYDLPEPELWGAGNLYVPAVGDLAFGAKEFQSFTRSVVGEAAASDGRAFDIPLVDFGISGSSAKAMLFLASSEWSVADLASAQAAASSGLGPSYGFVESKAEAVKIAIERRMHRFTYGGMTEAGYGGLFNSPKVASYDATGEGNLYGATSPKTPAQLVDWFQAKIADFKISSMLSYSSIVAYVDDALYTALCVPLGDNTGDNPYMRLTSTERGRFLGAIRPITELSPTTLADLGVLTPAATRGRMILGDFNNSRSVVRHFCPMNKSDVFLKDSGFHYGMTGWAASSEVDFIQPSKFLYINFAHS